MPPEPSPTATGPTRRGLLVGGTALFGLTALGAAGCALDKPGGGTLPTGVPDVATGAMVSGSFISARRSGAQVGWSIAYPPGHAPGGTPLPVLVVLHGRGGSHSDAFGASLHLDRFLAQAMRRGRTPFAIAAADGGDAEYWHPRQGTDPAGMIIDEFIPLLGRHGLDIARIGLLGWSMGGYGALYLSTVLRHRGVAVAVAESPAIWRHSYESVAGAFDNAQDFDRHAIFGRQADLRGIALRIDCGASDGFAPITRELRASIVPTPAGGIEPGGHDSAYWRSQAPAQLAFVGRHLA